MWLRRLVDRVFSGDPSVIKDDEEVVFFPTLGHRSDGGATWSLHVQGWIYEAEGDSYLRRRLMDFVCRAVGLDPRETDTELFRKRARAFLVDNERGKRLSIRLGGQTHALEPSGADGHFRGSLRLPAAEAALESNDGWLPFEAVTRPEDARMFRGRIRLVAEQGQTIVSDIDDTIKISDVHDRRELLANTFLREFRPVPGMASLYQSWEAAGAVFHYVSASPWQLYAPLSEFVTEHGFPSGTFHLKKFRPKDRSAANLFASPEETKRQAIVPLLQAFPQRRFILVGDSGEKDPEIYATLAREYPRQVFRILIRNTTAETPDSPRFQEAFRDLPEEMCQVFEDPREIG